MTETTCFKEIRVTRDDFDVGHEWHAARQRIQGQAGAMVSFVGLVRDRYLTGAASDAEPVDALELEHYPGMTEQSIAQIISTAESRWSLLDVVVVHRVGRLLPGDQIVFVQVASAHRPDAYAACEFLMDYLKTEAVFWKREHLKRGSRWVESTADDHARRASWTSSAE